LVSLESGPKGVIVASAYEDGRLTRVVVGSGAFVALHLGNVAALSEALPDGVDHLIRAR
jgi:hypothetical protein